MLGHDLRPSSPALAAACIQAVSDAGLKVVFVGALPTPAVAYFAATRKAPAIIITGSHIPFDRNGIKFYRANGEISKVNEQAMLATAVDVPSNLQPHVLPVIHAEAWAVYVHRYVSFFVEGALRGMRVAVYETFQRGAGSFTRGIRGFGSGNDFTGPCKLLRTHRYRSSAF